MKVNNMKKCNKTKKPQLITISLNCFMLMDAVLTMHKGFVASHRVSVTGEQANTLKARQVKDSTS